MRLKDFVVSSREKLREVYPPQEANSLVGVICSETLQLQSFQFLVDPDRTLEGRRLEQAQAAVERLAEGEPIQYILGHADFYGRRFNVCPSVLIPRPETELLCKLAIDAAMQLYRSRLAYGKDAKPVRILDLCTGSGCIAWTMALSVPFAEVLGVDVSQEALEVASSQGLKREREFSAPVFVKADVLDDKSILPVLEEFGSVDILVSNPPYILRKESGQMRMNVLEHEPDIALFVPDAEPMLFNKKIAEIFMKCANTDSSAFVEINETQGKAVEELLAAEGFENISVIPDISGRKRVVHFSKKA